MAGDGKKKQVRFARAVEEDEAADEEEEDTLFEKRPVGLRRGLVEEEQGHGAALDDEVRLAPSGRRRDVGRRETCMTGEYRWCSTTVLCAAFLGLGMAIAVLGPTFPDLAMNVDSSVANISYIFVGRSSGYLGGSVIGGILFDCMNHHLLLGTSMLATAAGLYAVPFCRKAFLLTGVMSIVGLAMGFLDTGGNIVIMNTWKDQSGPHVQALHFSFALGAFVAPLLAKLVLDILPLSKTPSNSDLPNISTPSQSQQVLKLLGLEMQGAMLSYIVIGTFILLVSLFFFILYTKSRPHHSTGKDSEEKSKTAKYHNALIFLLFLFFFFYVGTEVAFGSYIFTYAKQYVNMEDKDAAMLNSVFWGLFAAVRGLAICFATFMYPGTMLLLSVAGCTLASLLLVLFHDNRICLWAGSALYGASMATTFPSGFSWVQQYTTIGGKSASIFVVGAALGEMAVPASVGYLQGIFSTYPVLMYAALASSAMNAVLFPVMYKLATSSGNKITWDGQESEDRRALLSNSGQEEEEDDAQQWNEADFEAIEMNDRSSTVMINFDEMPGETIASDVINQTPLKNSNGTGGDQVVLVNKSPSKKFLGISRVKKD
ncbi:sodium-dependent glucose transporter 1 [Bombina bombina]|uniref:sodium-dependent glucose transporter 1 n=1 Tax=Bombina bombina TaxID=8345 RepID=UPI00235B2CA2|nr:sodium-dependent glucose transporter 1 [Bombina bombina]